MTIKDIQDLYPLSPMQQGMLFHSLYAPESGMYVEQFSCTLHGNLDVTAFERAWQRVVDRHSVLRTAFVGESLKEPAQVIYRQVKLPIEQEDLRGLSSVEQAARLNKFLAAERRRGFALSDAPLMRIMLGRITDDAYEFVWCHHHALLDGWSVPIVFQEVLAFYDAFSRGGDLRLEPPRPYRDYIVWLKRQDVSKAETFWRETLKGFTAPTPLVVDRSRGSAADASARAVEVETHLSAEATAALNALARKNRLTLNTLAQGAWALLLSRYSGEDQVVFGATVSGRPAELAGAETMVGLFINTLPVRVRVPPDASLLSWLKDLQTYQTELRQYEYSPLVQIQGWSAVPRGLPLFESIMVFENLPVGEALQEGKTDLEIFNVRSAEQTNYPITVIIGPARELMLKISYDSSRFDQPTILRMLGHLQTLLEGMASQPDGLLAAIPMLTQAERQQLLVEWNDTHADYPLDRCVHELFEAQVKRIPDAIALVYEEERVTYRELNRRANQLAHYLQKLGVGPEVIVGICVEPSIEMIVGVLGVLKAGGAYLPLDPTYPKTRLGFMLEDSHVLVLLTQERLTKQLPEHTTRVVCLDADSNMIARECDEDPISDVTPDNLAYVIYTSGSTGTPKGTLLQHRGLCNLANATIQLFDIYPTSRVLQFASFGFDASVAEIFPTLVAGATLCLARRDVLAGLDLIQFIQAQAITIATLPPSLLATLDIPADRLPGLHTLVSAGESCSPEIAARWSQGRRFINGYGPTETTVAASYYLVKDISEIAITVPIGRPMPNTQVYVLDKQLNPVPIGVPGELYVGGISLARGYLNRPELTAEKFISAKCDRLSVVSSQLANRDSQVTDRRALRLYKTGDLVRYQPDGNLEFLGRIDQQVKIRGFRIELDEIEMALSQQPAVRQAVVLAREEISGEKRLVAYVVPQETRSVHIEELRNSLIGKLPAYMIPSAFVALEALPLTPNGKVDRRALPVPDGSRPESNRTFVPPRDTIELQVTQIWEEILGVHPIGVKDNFFELGGHSLLALRLMARIQQQLDRKVSLVDLFQQPTVEHLASLVRRSLGNGTTPSSLVPIQPQGTKRPLFLVHPSGGSVHWYLELAHYLEPDQPLFGFQARGVDGDGDLHTRIEDMASYYVEALRAHQPAGPYLLGSWSMGVSVVYEMAQQLDAQGEQVALLAILDQGPVLPAKEPEDDAAYLVSVFGKQLDLSLDCLRRLESKEQMTYVWQEARKVDFIYPDVTLEQFSHFVRLLRTHTEAWRQYKPRPYSGGVTLFRAEERPEDDDPDPDLGWSKLATGGVEIRAVPGDHLSMLHEPHVKALAEQLKACLDSALDG